MPLKSEWPVGVGRSELNTNQMPVTPHSSTRHERIEIVLYPSKLVAKQVMCFLKHFRLHLSCFKKS